VTDNITLEKSPVIIQAEKTIAELKQYKITPVKEHEEEDDLLSTPVKKDQKASSSINENKPILNGNVTVYIVSHCLTSSVAMQYAVSLAKKRHTAYVETEPRNRTLQASCEKGAVKYYWNENPSELKTMVETLVHSGYEEVIVNSINANIVNELACEKIFYETLQDKELALHAKEFLSNHPQTMVVVSYFEPDLVSIKNLNKGIGKTMLRWANTRIEEYNSRLNSKLLANEAVFELTKGE